MLRAGKLRDRVTVQRKVKSLNDFNETVWTWEDVPDLVDMPAGVTALRGREFFAARQVQGEQTHQIDMRYRPNIDRTMRVVQLVPAESPAELYFRITDIQPDRRRTWLTLMCVVSDADGWRSDAE